MVFVNSRAVAPEIDHSSSPDGVGFDRDIELVLAFLNTCDAEKGTEILDDPGQWQQWCIDRDLGKAPSVDAAREIRDTMRNAVSYDGRPPAALRRKLPELISRTC